VRPISCQGKGRIQSLRAQEWRGLYGRDGESWPEGAQGNGDRSFPSSSWRAWRSRPSPWPISFNLEATAHQEARWPGLPCRTRGSALRSAMTRISHGLPCGGVSEMASRRPNSPHRAFIGLRLRAPVSSEHQLLACPGAGKQSRLKACQIYRTSHQSPPGSQSPKGIRRRSPQGSGRRDHEIKRSQPQTGCGDNRGDSPADEG